MHTELPPSGPASNPEVRYEKTDATVRPLYQFLFWISVITLLTAVISMVILRGLQSWRAGNASSRPTIATATSAMGMYMATSKCVPCASMVANIAIAAAKNAGYQR